MKKCMVVAAVLAAVLIGFTGCPNPAGKAYNPPPVTSTSCPLIAGKTYNVGSTLSVYAPLMKQSIASGNASAFSLITLVDTVAPQTGASRNWTHSSWINS